MSKHHSLKDRKEKEFLIGLRKVFFFDLPY